MPLILCACEPADNEPGPGGVTVGEARALDEAADMIEQRHANARAAGNAQQAEPADEETN